MKWSELGGKVAFVNPRGTSSYAYDGSGKLNRNTVAQIGFRLTSTAYINDPLGVDLDPDSIGTSA